MGGTAPRRGLRFALQMAQELGISEKSPDYRNPFKTDHSEVRWPRGLPHPVAAEGNGRLGGEWPETPRMEDAWLKRVRPVPRLGCGWVWVPGALLPGERQDPPLPRVPSDLKPWHSLDPWHRWACAMASVGVCGGGLCIQLPPR